MNITTQVREELINIPIEQDINKAWLTGILRAVGQIVISKKSLVVEFASDNYELITRLVAVIRSLYMCESTINIKKPTGKNKNKLYILSIPSGQSKFMLSDLRVMNVDGNTYSAFISGIDAEIYENQDYVRSFIRGLFLGVGSIYIPTANYTEDIIDDRSGMYNLEFNLTNEELAKDLVSMLYMFTIPAKISNRKDSTLVYLKDCESISNFFALIGANNIVFQIQDIILGRLVANDINRQLNCTMANMDKSINAGIKQVKSIEYIDKRMGLAKLPDNLRQIAILRMDMPTASLNELVNVLQDVTKSGLNHRLRKLMEIAQKLKDEDELYLNAKMRDRKTDE